MIRRFSKSNYSQFRDWFADCYKTFENVIKDGSEIECKVDADDIGTLVTISDVKRSMEQNDKYHAMISDFVKDPTFGSDVIVEADGKQRQIFVKFSDLAKKKGVEIAKEHAKAVFLTWFVQELEGANSKLKQKSHSFYDVRTGKNISVRPLTRKFSKKEAAAFIEFLYAEGSAHGINWSEASWQAINEHTYS